MKKRPGHMQPKKADIIVDVKRALAEDIGAGDVTAALLPENALVHATIISRESMLLCGQPWVDAVFSEVDPTIKIEWLVEEGAWLSTSATLCHLHGEARSILTAERTALNFLQTLSATATQTYHYLQQLKGLHTRLLDTRKTLPGLRLAQKYAVSCAGGVNHRLGLYDAFLIKENHIKACGSITNAVLMAKKTHSNLLIEVEVETLAELDEAFKAKPDRIMLDNFNEAMLLKAVAMNQPKQCELEVSGGVNLETIKTIAQTGVDYISVGAITKSIQAIDLSLLID
jgi:nicotinate-nucleotide pyrophosphorylase (carboxylating)